MTGRELIKKINQFDLDNDIRICFTEDGKIKPIRFRIEEEGKCQVVKIENIIRTELERFCGNRIWVFTCNVVTDNITKICEIKFDIKKGVAGCFSKFNIIVYLSS